MGLVLSRYRFERFPTIEEIRGRFHALTGLELIANQFGAHAWVLTAPPLRGDVELSFSGETVHLEWFIHFLRGGYFAPAVKQTLQDLGGHMPSHRGRYRIPRWHEMSAWEQWWSR